MDGERRDDWRHGVDENLASLNTGQRVSDRLLEDLDANYAAIDRLLRGDPEKEADGIIARLHHIETQIANLNSIIFMDQTGERGLQHDVKVLKAAREDRWQRWGNLTKIIVALAMSGLLGHFWRDIQSYLTKKDRDPIDQAIEHAKYPHPRSRRVIIRELPEKEQTN